MMCDFNPLRKLWERFPVFVVISVILTALLVGCPAPGPIGGTPSLKPVINPAAPAVPLLNVGNDELSVEWTAPDDCGSTITEYHVQHKLSTADWPTDDSTDTDTIAHTATNHVITGLANAQSYDVRVRAVNKAGAGDWSPPATETPDGTLPTAPTTFMLEVGDEILTATWEAPTNLGASGNIDRYEVQYRKTGASAGEWSNPISVDLTADPPYTYRITGLTNGTEYEVQVYAVSEITAHYPEERNGNSAIDTATPVTTPSAPTALALSPGNTQLSASWSAPTDTGGSAVTAYHLRYRTGGGAWTEISSGIGTSTQHIITGLTNGSTYEVQARAVNAQGNGSWSASETATPVTTPSAPTALTLSPGNTQLSASWSAPTDTGGSAVTAYHLRYRTGGGAWTEISSGIGTSTQYIINGLTNGSTYEVQARAVNAQGNSAWSASETVTAANVSMAPTALTLSPGNTQLSASWTAPTNTGGSAITAYHLRYRTGGGAWTEISSGIGTSTQHIITGLTNGSEYEVQARAVNAQGNSLWSASQTTTLPLIGTRVPVGTVAFVILSEDVHNLIASENLIVKLTTVEPNTAVLSPEGTISGIIPDDYSIVRPGVTVPTVNASTGIITVTASTTEGTYLIYGEKTDGTLWFAEYFYVTVSPQNKTELETALTTGESNWGNNVNLNYIITTAITDMSDMFRDDSYFLGDISEWDTSSVTDMSYMFYQASRFTADISRWDVSSVTNMSNMFNMLTLTAQFNSDISGWNVRSVTNMSDMFWGADAFNADISGWNVSSVRNMDRMFVNARAFNRDLEEWKDHLTLGRNSWNRGKYTGSKENMFWQSGVTGSLIPSWY